MTNTSTIIKPHPIAFLFPGVLWLFLFILNVIFVTQKWLIDGILWEKIFYFIIVTFNIVLSTIIFILIIQASLNIIIIENNLIINIKNKNLLQKNITQTPINNIEEIKTQISGILPTLFNYWKISIKNASWSDNIHIDYIQNPSKIADFILSKKKNIQ